jgi:hypothetical protein
MLAVALVYLKRYGVNVPYMDDLEIVPVGTGSVPVSLGWLWSLHNEHRILLPRLIMAGLFRLTYDVRAIMCCNILLLATAAAAMILVTRRLRGAWSVTDAVFPIALLNLGQAEVYLLATALAVLLPVGIAYSLIATVATLTDPPRLSVILRLGLPLVVLPICAANGLAMVPALGLWLVGWMVCGWWSGCKPGRGQVALGGTLLLGSALIVALHLYTFERSPGLPTAPSLGAVMGTALEYLSNGLCPRVTRYWRYSGAALVLLLAITLMRLAATWWRAPSERPRAAGLLLIIGSLVSIALALGVGRSGVGPGAGFTSRYIPMAATLPLALYVTWTVYGPRSIGRAIQLVVFLLACLSLPAGSQFATEIGADRRDFLKLVEHGLRYKVPGTRIVAATGARLYPDNGVVYERFCMLRAAGVGRFRWFRDDPFALGDVDGDGHADVIRGAGSGERPLVTVKSGADGRPLAEFLAYDPGFLGGVHVAAGDLDGDDRPEIITITGPGGGCDARAFHVADRAVEQVAHGTIWLRRSRDRGRGDPALARSPTAVAR